MGEHLGYHDDGDAESDCEPGGLHALVDGGGSIAGAVPARCPSGRAVLDERPDDDDEGQQRGADAEAGQRDGPQVPHDGGVHEDVQRLGREHHER